MIKNTERQFITEMIYHNRNLELQPPTKQEAYYLSKWTWRGWWVADSVDPVDLAAGRFAEGGRMALADLFGESIRIHSKAPMTEKRLRKIWNRHAQYEVVWSRGKDGSISKMALELCYAPEGPYEPVPVHDLDLRQAAREAHQDREALLKYVNVLQNKIKELEASKDVKESIKDHLDSPDHRRSLVYDGESYIGVGKGPTATRSHHVVVWPLLAQRSDVPLAHILSHALLQEIRSLL